MIELQTYLRELQAAIPEFKSRWSNDLPTLVLGELGTFLRDRLTYSSANDAVTQKIFSIINDAMNAGENPELHNAIQVGVFEPLGDRRESASAALISLTGEARAVFIHTLKWVAPELFETIS